MLARLAVVPALALALGACSLAHLDRVGLDADGRDLRDLFLGGWDGHRLTAFDESTLEPGLTTRAEALHTLGFLSAEAYALVYVERAKLDASAAAAHDLFCEAPACLVVLDRKRGSDLSGWGDALAVVELSGLAADAPIGAVWIAGAMVRPPGPRRWDLLCRSREDKPRWVHTDGGALFPAREGRTDGFARFGRDTTSAEYRRGTAAPSDATCDEEAARVQREEPVPERPVFKPDPTLLPPDPGKAEKPARPAKSRGGKRK